MLVPEQCACFTSNPTTVGMLSEYVLHDLVPVNVTVGQEVVLVNPLPLRFKNSP
jgi:hypothetical protein